MADFRSRKSLALALSLVLIGSWFAVQQWRTAPDKSETAFPASVGTTVSVDPVEPSPDPVPEKAVEQAALTPVPEEAPQREAVEATVVLRGRVTTDQGDPLEGATVSWIAWDPEFIPFITSFVEIPPERILETMLWAKTDSNGEYGFAATPERSVDEDSFIHITHPEHTSRVIELKPGETNLAERATLELSAAAPMHAVVVEAGKLVAGARIYQQATFPHGITASYDLGNGAPKGRLLFLRTYEPKGDQGQAIAGCEFPQRLWAEKEGRRSAPWTGDHTAQVRLELRACFELSGTVFPPDSPPEGWSEGRYGTSRIRVHRARGPLVEEITSIDVGPNGLYGPVRVPLLEADHYQVSLDGSGFIPVNRILPVPHPEERVQMDFEAEVGHSLWFIAEDSSGAPIPNAEVIGRWQSEGRHIEKRFPGRPDGYVFVPGLPSGSWEGVIRADGYAPTSLGTYVLPMPEATSFLMVLTRGATLRGQCLAGLQPQEDFELRYWNPSSLSLRATQQVIGSEDGSFVIENLPGTQVAVCAIGPGYERSETRIIQLSKHVESETVLILEAAGEMSGRVIDAATGAPIEDSRAEIYSTHVMYEMDPIGEAYPTTGGGQFAVGRLARGINVVCFRAPGYSSRELKVWYEGSDVDLGDIELTPLAPLTARLSLPEGEDPSLWVLASKGITALPPIQFDAGGELFMEECHAGVYRFEVVDLAGMGKSLVSQLAWLKAGEPWHLEFDLSSGPTLTIVASGEGVGEAELWATITQRVAGNALTSRRFLMLDKKGEVRVSGMGTGMVSIGVRGKAGSSLAGYAVFRIAEDEPAEILVDVPVGNSKMLLRVVDPQGAPQQGMNVSLRSTRWPNLKLGQGTTSADGICIFRGVHGDVDLLALNSAYGGAVEGLPFELPSQEGEVVEVVFSADASIELHIVDGGVPQPLTTCRLLSADGGTYILPGRSPDENGLLVFEHLGEGTYELRVVGHGYWPATMPVHATDGGERYDVEIRRTGNLVLRLRDSAGVVLAGRDVALRYVPLSADVQGWLDGGKLDSGTGALRTDSTGELSLGGLPHGEYRWACANGTGTLTVVAAEETIHEVYLP